MGEVKITTTTITTEEFTAHSGLVSVEFKIIDGKLGRGRLILVRPGQSRSQLFINLERLEDIALATQKMLEALRSIKSVSGGNNGEYKGR